MRRQIRSRFWVEATLGAVAGSLAVLTVVWHDWIEAVFRVDLDHHSGALEWAVVGVLVAVAITASALARLELRRPLLSNQF
jgi:hypothetical protein